MKVLVVKADGELLPQAGIWKDTEYGQSASQIYQKKDGNCEIVEAELTEV